MFRKFTENHCENFQMSLECLISILLSVKVFNCATFGLLDRPMFSTCNWSSELVTNNLQLISNSELVADNAVNW